MNKKEYTIENSLFAGLYTFSYMAIGTLTPMIAQYLKYLGFSGSNTGVITSTGTCVAIFAVAFWGKGFNRASKKERIVALLCAGAVVTVTAFTCAKSFIIVTLLFGVLYFFQAPIISLVDAYTVRLVDISSREKDKFGSKRAWGAVGFAVGVFATGVFADKFGTESIFLLYVGAFAITGAVVLLIGRWYGSGNERVNKKREVKGSYGKLLSSGKLCMFIAFTFFMGGTNVANNTYFSFLYIEGGGSLAGTGVALLLMVASEIPFMAFCEKLAEKFTSERILLIAAIISSGRFLLYGIGLPWQALIATFFLQGAVNGIILVEFVRTVSRLAPEGCKSLAVSAYYMIGSNISTILCQFAGGIILDVFGATGVYTFFGLFNLTGVIVYIIFLAKYEKN